MPITRVFPYFLPHVERESSASGPSGPVRGPTLTTSHEHPIRDRQLVGPVRQSTAISLPRESRTDASRVTSPTLSRDRFFLPIPVRSSAFLAACSWRARVLLPTRE